MADCASVEEQPRVCSASDGVEATAAAVACDGNDAETTEGVAERDGSKIRLTNVPKFLSTSVLRRAVADHLAVSSDLVVCRKGDKWNFALLSFKAAGPLLALGITEIANKLQDFKFKKYAFGVKVEEPRARLQIQSSPAEGGVMKCLNDQVTPLWKMSYDEQLQFKESKMRSVLAAYWKKLHSGPGGHGGRASRPAPHALEPIQPSPLLTGYRNKCEFTIGRDRTGAPTVGFSLGGFRDGLLMVENARDCVHVPAAIKAVADYFEAFLRQDATLVRYPVHDRVTKQGLWRILLVRQHGDALMAAVQVQDGVLADKDAFKSELSALFSAFNSESAVKVESLFVQFTSMLHHGISAEEPFVHIPPSRSVLTERLAGLDFQISPSSFFQVNLPATEVLYANIKRYAMQTGPRPVLLDVCCGTGTIGMIMASDVERVVGIEMVESAVADARLNAALNGVENIEFKCARVEQVARDVIADIPQHVPIVVVLDPPRSGVHPDVIKAVRACPRIDRVVFVACNPTAVVPNLVDLSRPTSKAFGGPPFVFTRAVPIDMFPQTEHCELVLQFDRERESRDAVGGGEAAMEATIGAVDIGVDSVMGETTAEVTE